MNTTPALSELLRPRSPLLQRARPLRLVHPAKEFQAWIAHVEAADLAGLSPETFLTVAEMARAAAFRFEPPRQSFLLGRLAAKLALGAYLNESDWSRIGVANGVLGQPVVMCVPDVAVEISLSHSEGFAVALAFPPEHPMGVDLETVDPDRAATAKSELKLSAQEQHWIRSAGVEERAAYIVLWTVREALGKALRCGLMCPLEFLAVGQISSLAEGVWASHYRHFGQFTCLSWVGSDRVLSVALPQATALLL